MSNTEEVGDFEALQRAAARSAVVQAALEFVAENGSETAAAGAEPPFGLQFGLDWDPAEYGDIVARRAR